MERVSRKVVYRLYPSRSQEAALLDMLGLHQRLYNAALEQRKAAISPNCGPTTSSTRR